VISEVRRLLGSDEPARAVLIAFETALRDFEATFGLEPPAHWTYSDFFRLSVRADMSYAPVLLARLYRDYEPVRYGRFRGRPPGDLVRTLRLLYELPALRPIEGLAPGIALGIRARGIPVNSPRPAAAPVRPA
jgi:hypothetical protein